MVDVYKVSVAIALTDNISAALGLVTTKVLGLDKAVKGVGSNIGSWSNSLKGVALMLGATGILGAMAKLVDKTAEYNKELAKLSNLGTPMAAAVNSGAIQAKAFGIAQRVPMKVEDLLKIPGSLYSILGKDEAMQVWEPTARAAFVMKQQGYGDDDVGKSVQTLIRAGELSGRITDPVTGKIVQSKLLHFLDEVTKITAATHGMVNPASMLATAQQAGIAMRGLSDKGFESMMILNQAMGGHRAGTAYMSLWQQLAAGKMFTRTAEAMQDVGLLQPSDWYTDHGRVVLSDQASKRLTNLAGTDPLDFVAHVDDALKARGITDPQDRTRMILRLANRQTTGRMLTEESANLNQILAERQRLEGGAGVDASMGNIMNKDLAANMTALQSAWHNLLIAVAGPSSKNFIDVLQNITAAVNAATSVAAAHPEAMGVIAKGLASIAGAMAGASIGFFTFGPIGAAIGAVIGLTGSLIGLNWKSLSSGLTDLKDAITSLASIAWGSIVSGIKSIIDSITSLFDKVKGIFHHAPDAKPGAGGVFPGGTFRAPTSFHPGTKPMKAQPISLSLNVDGQMLAQATSDQLGRFYNYPTGSAPNDSSRWSASDAFGDDI